MCGYLHSSNILVCRGSYLLWFPLQATHLSYCVGVRSVVAAGVLSGGRFRFRLPLPLHFVLVVIAGSLDVDVALSSVVSGLSGRWSKSAVSVAIVGYASWCSVIDCAIIAANCGFHMPFACSADVLVLLYVSFKLLSRCSDVVSVSSCLLWNTFAECVCCSSSHRVSIVVLIGCTNSA